MKELYLNIRSAGQPKYQRLADSLRISIRSGKLIPGEYLPSSRDLARRCKMHRHTVMNALRELEAEGWIIAVEKKYYQVTKTLPSTFLQARASHALPCKANEGNYDFARSLDIGDYKVNTGHKYAFPSGFPDLSLFPLREFKSHMIDCLKSHKLLGYGDPSGHPRLIKQIEHYLRRVRNVDGREIIITNGSQEAIFLLAQLFIKPGDFIAVEELGYPPAFEALKFAGAKLVPIVVDSEGLVVEDLERQIKKRKIKFLYLTPLHQYPTTVTLSANRRLRLYELAQKNGILILEDDYDHEFHFISQPIAPLASFDPAKIVLYVSTFSKVLFPSARLGFMAVHQKIAKEVTKLKRISSRQNEQILQEAIARWMEDGGFERHLRKMRRTYEERRNAMIATLAQLQKKYPRISWIEPDGGMALWLNTSINSKVFSEKALKHDILVSPENLFRLNGKQGTHLRLGFSGQAPAENQAGLETLFSLL